MEQTLEPLPLDAIAGDLARIGQKLAALEERGSVPDDEGGNVLLSRLVRATSFVDSALRVLTDKEQQAPSWKSSVELPHPVEDLQGSSRAVPIQDLLSFLANSRKSGLLRVHAPGERFLIQLEDGVVVYACGDDPPTGEGLGELLLSQGTIRPEQRGLLAPTLLQEGWLPPDELRTALTRQARLALFRLFAADGVRYWFYERARIQNGVKVRLNAMELLFEYTRRRDEASEAARRTLRGRLRRMLKTFAL